MKYNRKQYPYISKFQLIYEDIIKDSKNIPIPQILTNQIFNKFKNNTELIFTNKQLYQLDKTYKNLSEDQNYFLTVIITDEKGFDKMLKKYQSYLITYSINQLKEEFILNNGSYIRLSICGLLVLNYNALSNNKKLLNQVIKHELTHYFEYINNSITTWHDLLPVDPKQLDTKAGLILVSLFQYNMTYKDLYYFTCGKQFQAYCTSLSQHKSQFNQNILKNLTNAVINGNILSQPIILRNLYLFIFLNLQFDQTKQRIKYIKQHLY